MSLLDWLKPRKLAVPRLSRAPDLSANLIRDLIALRTPMSLATLKAASDAASGTALSKQPDPIGDPLPPVVRCAMASIGVTPVF